MECGRFGSAAFSLPIAQFPEEGFDTLDPGIFDTPLRNPHTALGVKSSSEYWTKTQLDEINMRRMSAVDEGYIGRPSKPFFKHFLSNRSMAAGASSERHKPGVRSQSHFYGSLSPQHNMSIPRRQITVPMS
jgi:hypothetical protein